MTALSPIRDRFPEFADLLATEPHDDLFDALQGRADHVVAVAEGWRLDATAGQS